MLLFIIFCIGDHHELHLHVATENHEADPLQNASKRVRLDNSCVIDSESNDAQNKDENNLLGKLSNST
jgi:hypothetical protein